MDHLEEIRLVEELGSKIGYGNMMSIASSLWAETLDYEYGDGTSGGAFIPAIMPYIKDEFKDTVKCQSAVARSWIDVYREKYGRKSAV